MTVYAWNAAWKPMRWEMRVMPNTRTFVGPYTPYVQSLDLLGERFKINFDFIPTLDPIMGSAQEAFFDRLRGQVNQIQIWNLQRPVPQGTLRDGIAASWVNSTPAAVAWTNAASGAVTWITGSPVLKYDATQLANTISINTVAGRTLRAGDCIGIGTQMSRVMADATADSTGLLSVEILPRLRSAYPAYTPIVWNKPTINCIVSTGDGVPTVWQPGYVESTSIELLEVI